MKNKVKVVPKAKRHEFYKQALVKYMEHHRHLHLGLCCLLKDITGMECYGEDMQRFPEIYKYRPENTSPDNYWWPPINSKARIAVLKEAIKLTKLKSDEKPRRRTDRTWQANQ